MLKEASVRKLEQSARRNGLQRNISRYILWSPALHFSLCLFGLLSLWYLIARFALVPRYMLPSPLAVAKAFSRYYHTLFLDSYMTIRNAAAGLGLALLVAVVIAAILVHSRVLLNMILPLI